MKGPTTLLFVYLLVISYIQDTTQLKIKSVNIPPVVKAGSVDYVILDCDYDLENTSSQGLVVKWYFNGVEVAYQWIIGTPPRAGELAEKYVDLTYKASDDPNTEYRAMKLNKPGIDLSGEYMCVIFTYQEEQTANASMIVYSEPEEFNLRYIKKSIDDQDGTELTCTAEGVYPRPTLDITIEGVSVKQPKPMVTQRDNRLYNIMTQMALLDEEMPNPAFVKCVLSIPQANYTVFRETLYYPGTSTTTATSTATTKLHSKMEVQALNNSVPSNGGGGAAGRSKTSALFVLMQITIFSAFYL